MGSVFARRSASARSPAGKRLDWTYSRDGLEIRLIDAPAGTEVEARPVPVPRRVSRLHPVARQFRDRSEFHEVSRAALSRCARLVHALATEAERRGYTVANVSKSRDRSGWERWSGNNDGHLRVTIRGHSYRLRVSEEKVRARGAWEPKARWHGGGAYDADATGRLTIVVDSGYGREGRAASWADRRSWTLEAKLPDLLRELEVRAVEDDHREAEARRAAEERRRRWEQAMEQARHRFEEAHRAKILENQIASWQHARLIRDYLSLLEQAHASESEPAQWISWIRGYLERLDPLASAPVMPETPEPSPTDLKPFLNGLSPYGPDHW